jgi:hypothetical protein
MAAWLKLLEALTVAGIGKERLQDLLLAGDVKLRFHLPNGTTSPVPPDCLTRATIDWTNSRIDSTLPPAVGGFGGPVEVDRQTLLANAGDAPKAPGKGGGRPPKWDWEAAAIDVIMVIYGGGVREPERQADVERLLHEWFINAVGEAAAESEIRRHAKKLFEGFQKA